MPYNVISTSEHATVVAEYTPASSSQGSYQSENEMEQTLIKHLREQGYEYVQITSQGDLTRNLRKQLQRLNKTIFSDREWSRFLETVLCRSNLTQFDKSYMIQKDHIQLLQRDDGSTANIYLVDKKNVHNNHLQVLNQYEETGGKRTTRYDVTILMNGLPMVHIELKRRGVQLREAFNQIRRYQRESFWASSGLYDYIQLFVISNGVRTKYYSNTVRQAAVKEHQEGRKSDARDAGSTFEFTSYWADAQNKNVLDIEDFTRTFFVKHTLLNVLIRYCILDTQEKLLVMRPYQIAATEAIISRIRTSAEYKQLGTINAGGYIWHTTGSGKTLTSFKAAILATEIPTVEKVLFVVDRKDLDAQTMREYNNFQEGSANGNTSAKILTKQLKSPSDRIIITTIQKLSVFIKQNENHSIYDKHVVLIFDECHRSQFGTMHQGIIKKFKKYHLFGFTGTPIFARNASAGLGPQTTEQVFGECLHAYTIVHAISDKNVLPFKVDYVNTIRERDIEDRKVHAINTESALMSPERVDMVVDYILDHFDSKTKRQPKIGLEDKRAKGFNSIFAVSSIEMAKRYYMAFEKKQAERLAQNGTDPLVVATIFSYSPNEDLGDDFLPDESFDTHNLDMSSRDFLEATIRKFNEQFSTSYSASSDQFENYYRHLSERVRNREVDILIVVNMFLTGFDAKTLNTLWVDKNLRQHGLIQAFSRTNRILNSVKVFGNIVCFRNLKEETDEALSIFGDKDAGGIVLLRTFNDYYFGHTDNMGIHRPGYQPLIEEMLDKYPYQNGSVAEIIGEERRKAFVGLFGSVLRVRNILETFDEFEGKEILDERQRQDFTSVYLDIYDELRGTHSGTRENIDDDVVFEMELVKQDTVNVDYILILVDQYRESNKQDKEILANIYKFIDASTELRSKKQLIEAFLDQITLLSDVQEDWEDFVKEEMDREVSNLISELRLKDQDARNFIYISFLQGEMITSGSYFDRILPPMSRFGQGAANRAIQKAVIAEKLVLLYEKYSGIVSPEAPVQILSRVNY